MNESWSVASYSLWPHGLYSPLTSLGWNTGVGSLSLLQGIFPTLGSNPGRLHCRQILYQLSHKGSPRILNWIDYPFSIGSFQPRNWTGVSCIAGGFFTSWTIREASWEGSNIIKMTVIKGWQEDQHQREKMEAEVRGQKEDRCCWLWKWRKGPYGKECRFLSSWKRQGMDSPLEPPGDAQSCEHILDLWPPEL